MKNNIKQQSTPRLSRDDVAEIALDIRKAIDPSKSTTSILFFMANIPKSKKENKKLRLCTTLIVGDPVERIAALAGAMNETPLLLSDLYKAIMMAAKKNEECNKILLQCLSK